MKMVTEDMAKFTYFLSRQGEWEGKQLLRKEWFERACRKQIETEGDSEGHVKDWAQGYGYQCWMCRYPGSFRADGAYGQFGVVFPDLDLIVILTTATEQTQEELSALQEELIPYVKKEAGELPPSPLAGAVKERTADLALPPRRGTRNPFMEEKVSKHVYVSAPADGEPAAAGFRRNSDRRKRPVFAGDKSDSGDAILPLAAIRCTGKYRKAGKKGICPLHAPGFCL